ncbi:hypothetical protein BW737_014850 [Actinomyces ruminis]|uniref:Low molecular weight protein antigen 6 PH domain-containing protein n=1 Tax=Actinomyces ruminis TaxID=1937003 RepID=A0ABX4M8F5_9ACTO|nr:hypothetical protein BW737_014850 [Actinomyces ruminis]
MTGVGTTWVVITVWLADGTRNGLQALGCGLLLMLAVWCLWWAPQLTIAYTGITVRNAWRTHHLGWSEVDSCRTRWGLEIVTFSGRTFKASAAQRAGGCPHPSADGRSCENESYSAPAARSMTLVCAAKSRRSTWKRAMLFIAHTWTPMLRVISSSPIRNTVP